MQGTDEPHLIEFAKVGSPSIGFISVAENQQLPFSVERVYWTYFTPNEVIRGNHAHKNLQQILLAVAGQITIETETKTGIKTSFTLTKPHHGLFIPSLCWRTLQFSHNAVLLCLASAQFTEADYIRNYEEFKKITNHGIG